MTHSPQDPLHSRRSEEEGEPHDVGSSQPSAAHEPQGPISHDATGESSDSAAAEPAHSAGPEPVTGEEVGDAAAMGGAALTPQPTSGETAAASGSRRRRKKPRISSWQRLRHSPRGMVLAWCFWLLMSWFAALWIDSATVAVRLMVFSSLFGLTIMWPLLRLSEGNPPMDPKRIAKAAGREQVADERGEVSRALADPGLEPDMADGATAAAAGDGYDTQHTRRHPALLTAWWVMLDWLWLIMVFQAVIWPLRLTAGWTIEQTLWLDVAVAGWSLLVGAAVAWGCQFPRGEVRTVAMALCAVLVFGEPLLMGLINVFGGDAVSLTWTMHISPIQVIWELSQTPVQYSPQPSAGLALTTGVAAVLVWVAVIVAGVRADKAPREAAGA